MIFAVVVVGSGLALRYSVSGSSGCSGYPPGGNCVASYTYTFTLSVNYPGPWRLNWQSQGTIRGGTPVNSTGSRTGQGGYETSVYVSSLNNRELILCAQAQKLDGSNSTLTLTIILSKNTTLPFGEVTMCNGVAP